MSPDDDDDLGPRPLLRPKATPIPPPPPEPRASFGAAGLDENRDLPRPPPSRSTLPPPSSPLLASRRGVHVLGTIGVAVAFVGFFTGIAQEGDETRRYEAPEAVATAPAPGYKQLRAERRARTRSSTWVRLSSCGPRSPRLATTYLRSRRRIGHGSSRRVLRSARTTAPRPRFLTPSRAGRRSSASCATSTERWWQANAPQR